MHADLAAAGKADALRRYGVQFLARRGRNLPFECAQQPAIARGRFQFAEALQPAAE